MKNIHHILQQYWGYTTFRPLQQEIIQAVLAGQDVLALLPTGGGKSICFQVPALAREGVCLVVTPLIALMKDQVAQLKRRGIPAAAIFAGMRPREIDLVLDNSIYGQLKLLYVSPERLKTELFQERVQKMAINLLAIDEAHCISQWGYDFRPAYLAIADLRPLIPTANIIALTATATRAVKQDIQARLQMHNTALFQQSFARDNLAYVVRKTEDKGRTLLRILSTVRGTAIIYTYTRKKAKEVANFLSKHSISASFYHAGLSNEERTNRQDAWIQDKTRVIVATNAFGMGIDKPDVRLVVHVDLPTTLEAYYQEAGRAGRDEQKAYAIVLYDEQDIDELRTSIQEAHPTVEYLKKVYQHLANYYQVAVGTHAMTTYDFDWENFASAYRLRAQEAYQAIKRLESEGLIQLNEAFSQPSRVHMAVDHQALYAFQVAHAAYDSLIKALLRLYGGELWTDFCNISEKKVAQYLHTEPATIIQHLHALHRLGIIQYSPQKDKPQLTWITPRYPASQVPLDTQKLSKKSKSATEKAESVIHYVTHPVRCRSQLLLAYFDEVSYRRCRVCDICLAKAPGERSQDQRYQHYRALVLQRLQAGVDEPRAIIDSMPMQDETALVATIRQMLESEEIVYDQAGRLAQLAKPLKQRS
ncbi:MAG: ATP-dependent DNA helicase RecQ [Bacteroidota bacterium]